MSIKLKLTRKPARQSRSQGLMFYATRVAIIQDDLSKIKGCYITCENFYEDWIEIDPRGTVQHVVKRCIDLELEPCKACMHNKAVYAEKRKLSNLLSKTMPQLIKYSKIESENICKKLEPSFVDENYQGDDEC